MEIVLPYVYMAVQDVAALAIPLVNPLKVTNYAASGASAQFSALT